MKSKSHYHWELTEWDCGATGKFEEQQSRGLDLDFAEIKARQKRQFIAKALLPEETAAIDTFTAQWCIHWGIGHA